MSVVLYFYLLSSLYQERLNINCVYFHMRKEFQMGFVSQYLYLQKVVWGFLKNFTAQPLQKKPIFQSRKSGAKLLRLN